MHTLPVLPAGDVRRRLLECAARPGQACQVDSLTGRFLQRVFIATSSRTLNLLSAFIYKRPISLRNLTASNASHGLGVGMALLTMGRRAVMSIFFVVMLILASGTQGVWPCCIFRHA